MKINGNAVRPGYIIEHKNRLWRVLSVSHVKPGKGGAYAQVDMKDVKTGGNSAERFRANEQVERARVEAQDYQFLFREGEACVFMNTDTYEQINLMKKFLDNAERFLKEGMTVVLETYEGEALSIRLPDTVTLEVLEADAVVKGQTAASSYKPALLEGNIKVQVPPHIVAGNRIVVNTADTTFVERAKG